MDISKLDRQGLLDYIESLEAKTASLEEKMEDLKAQVDVLNIAAGAAGRGKGSL